MENLTQPSSFIGKYDTFLLRGRRWILSKFSNPSIYLSVFLKELSYSISNEYAFVIGVNYVSARFSKDWAHGNQSETDLPCDVIPECLVLTNAAPRQPLF